MSYFVSLWAPLRLNCERGRDVTFERSIMVWLWVIDAKTRSGRGQDILTCSARAPNRSLACSSAMPWFARCGERLRDDVSGATRLLPARSTRRSVWHTTVTCPGIPVRGDTPSCDHFHGGQNIAYTTGAPCLGALPGIGRAR